MICDPFGENVPKVVKTTIEIYSVSSLIRTSLIRILAYPNSQKQDYNIIHKHFNDIHM